MTPAERRKLFAADVVVTKSGKVLKCRFCDPTKLKILIVEEKK